MNIDFTTGILDISANRHAAFFYPIRFKGIKWTGDNPYFDFVVREYPEAPGSALLVLGNSDPLSQGVSFRLDGDDTVVTPYATKDAMEAFPVPTNGGGDITFYYDLRVTCTDPRLTRICLRGKFNVISGVTR